MKIALVQLSSPDTETPAHRVERVRTTLSEMDSHADLIVLPELWTVGFHHFGQYRSAAETFDGPTIQTLRRIASAREAYIHAGSIIEDTGHGTLRNTAVLIDPRGQIVHFYSKTHSFGFNTLEARILDSGLPLHTAARPMGEVAATMRADLRSPDLWPELVNAGAELVIVPAAWPAARREQWRLLTSAHALNNQVFVIACNASGTHGRVELAGNSRVLDPSGNVVAEAGPEESVLITEIDPSLIDRSHAELPVLEDSFPDSTILNARKVPA
ncbi:carbon-nitrogen family hydrolase [Hoyosella sp. YIM 151337]|uniref:nitrilase-related carbon-nitrogen hydrolase n=1 Tax=Hoyosella sp. YIM 151337 TaxID=2992742 RepID=UPI002235AD4B|nr:nitrilase-related carbon-nitrogen hydrolase [Hoyosella sp. YIM 151337]MCW4354127.1 carbon-nitrogen family hydrolase [Hoyosella sp. YIM 151337]